MIENANYAVALGRDKLHLSLVGVGGVDLAAGNKKLVLGARDRAGCARSRELIRLT